MKNKSVKTRQKVGAIIQARMSSTRLPGKILKELPFNSGITILQQIIRRLKKCKKLNDIIVATTTNRKDQDIVDIAKKEKIKYSRGSEDNVLSRYYWTSKNQGLDVIVRIASDRPCIDYEVVDLVVDKHLQSASDYTSNTIDKTYPCGMDVEVFDFSALERAYKSAKKNYEKEHVTPYIYRNPHIFKISQVISPPETYSPDIRVTIDTEEDYALLCLVYDYLYGKSKYFGVRRVVNLFNKKPWLKLINKKTVQKEIFDTLDNEIGQAIKILELQGLNRAKNFICNIVQKRKKV